MNFGTNFEPLMTRQHPVDPEGVQHVFKFQNGYGASVIRYRFSYGVDRGLWELAVVSFDDDGWHINYETPITSDVIGHLTETEVAQLLRDINACPHEPHHL